MSATFKVGEFIIGRYKSANGRIAKVVALGVYGNICLLHTSGRAIWSTEASVYGQYDLYTGEPPKMPSRLAPLPREPNPQNLPPRTTVHLPADEPAANATSTRLVTDHPVYGSLRLPQARMVDFLENKIATGSVSRSTTLAIVPPGYGKTLMASIFCHHHVFHLGAKYVLWVAPRVSLCDQVQAGFYVPSRGLTLKLGRWEDGDRVEQVSTDGTSICGFVVTNQTSLADLAAIVASFGGAPFVVVFDEFHHLKDKENPTSEEDWTSKANVICAQPNMMRRLLMSGTPWRHDGYGLPYLSEHKDSAGKVVPDVAASRYEALREQASLPLFFVLFDALVKFEYKGNVHQLHLSDASEDMAPKALEAFLKIESVWRECVQQTLHHWARYREESYPSRLIVVCATQDMARLVRDHLRELQYKVALAINEEPEAHANVRDFRTKTGRSESASADVLVTCKMAHEGLDVPDVSHILYLHNHSTTQNLDQCFARSTRVDRESGVLYEKQRAYVFAPAVWWMKQYVEELKLDQRDIRVTERVEGERLDSVSIRQIHNSFHPLGGSLGDTIEGDDDGLLTPDQNDLVKRTRREFPLAETWPPRSVLHLANRIHQQGAA